MKHDFEHLLAFLTTYSWTKYEILMNQGVVK